MRLTMLHFWRISTVWRCLSGFLLITLCFISNKIIVICLLFTDLRASRTRTWTWWWITRARCCGWRPPSTSSPASTSSVATPGCAPCALPLGPMTVVRWVVHMTTPGSMICTTPPRLATVVRWVVQMTTLGYVHNQWRLWGELKPWQRRDEHFVLKPSRFWRIIRWYSEDQIRWIMLQLYDGVLLWPMRLSFLNLTELFY